MKKLWNNLIGTYLNKSGKWLISALLTLSFLPLILKSASMLIRQNAIPAWLLILYDLLGWLGAWILFSFAFWHMDGHPKVSFFKASWNSFKRGGLWLIAIASLSGMAYKFFASYGGLLTPKGSQIFYMVIQVGIAFVTCLLLAAAMFWLLCIIADARNKASFFKSFLYWLKKPLLSLGSILSAGLLLYGVPLFYDLMLKIIPGLSLSFMELVAGGVCLILMEWAILQPALTIFFKNACKCQSPVVVDRPVLDENTIIPSPDTDQGNAPSEIHKPESFIKAQLATIIAIVIILASSIYNLFTGYPLSAVPAVAQDIQYYIDTVNLVGRAGDPAAAAYFGKTAEARILAWQGAVLNTPDSMNQAVNLAPSDEQVQLLAALSSTDKLAALEQGFLYDNRSKAWHLALLDEYSKIKSLTESQKLRRAELLRICILKGYYTQSSVMPKDLTANKDSFAKMLDGFNKDIISIKYYALTARAGEDGGINKQLVFDTLDMAEKYPTDINLQYLAMTYGTGFLEDNATHYGRAAEAALRYDDLFMHLKAKNISQDQILQEKLTVAKSLLTLGKTQASLDFLSSVQYKNTELSMLKASILFSQKSYEKCLTAVDELLKQNGDNAQALYLASMSTLELKDISGSLGYASRLAKLAENPNDQSKAESLLYPYLLRFTINDPAGRYNTESYSTLNDEQIALLKSNDFLYSYMTAAYLWTKQNDQSRTEALGLLDKVLSVNKNLSRALYMKGAILFEQNQNDKALESFKASLSIDEEQPTVWYAVANLYDRAQKYEEAYAACQKVLEYLPSTDHASDVFGVSVHASQLMEKLKPYVKEGK